ncbi:unnamed protein product, partial [marine sediment metagenome]
AHWLLQVENNEARLIQAGGTTENDSPASSTSVATGPYDLNDKTGFINEFADDVRRIYRWQNLRRLAGEYATAGSDVSSGGLELEFVKCRDASSTECEPVPAGDRLPVGQKARIRMRNTGRSALDVTLLMLDASFGIDALFPSAGQYGRLRPSEHHSIDLEIIGDTMGKEHFVVIAVPSQKGVQRADFAWLAQPALRLEERTRGGGGRTPLEELLATAVFAEGKTRGVKLSGSESVQVLFHLITWETVPVSTSDSRP